jgi:hypothetical protein
MSSSCRVRVTGPLAMYADGFRAELAAQGYVAGSADRNLRTLAHVSRWMDSQGLSVGQLSTARLEEFLEVRRRDGYHHALSVRAAMPLISYLRRLGVGDLPAEAPAGSGTVDVLAGQYRGYLVSERALTPQVVATYARLAREFLAAACQQPDARADRASGGFRDRLRGGGVSWPPSRLGQVPGHRPAVACWGSCSWPVTPCASLPSRCRR